LLQITEKRSAIFCVYIGEECWITKSIYSTKEKTMDYSTIADWLTILFLLWFGLKKFIPALDKDIFSTIGAIFALAAAVFTALST